MRGFGTFLLIAALLLSVVFIVDDFEKRDKEIAKLKHDLQVCQTTHKR